MRKSGWCSRGEDNIWHNGVDRLQQERNTFEIWVKEARTVQMKSSLEFLLACLVKNFNCKVLTQGKEVGVKSFNEKNTTKIRITSDFCCILTCVWRRNYFSWNHSSLQTPVLYQKAQKKALTPSCFVYCWSWGSM